MKLLVVLLVLVAFCYGSPTPLIPGDNSHYVEGESRYIWFPDGKGVPQLVDLLERPSDEELQRNAGRNGADNQYWLFTRQNPTSQQIITHGNASTIWSSNYQNRATVVIVHGWNNDGTSDVNTRLTAAFLNVMDCNVIVVDWSDLASSLYWTAVNGVPDVGLYLGDFLIWLIDTAGGDWNLVHLVGHSLGAHVCGNAGRRTGNLPMRITALDPAGPNFGSNSNALQASDGQYVECIHTDGGVLGIMDPICQANFYPNGGQNPQPGCWISTCSHSRSHALMESTIYNNHLVGRICTNWKEFTDCDGDALQMGNAVWNKSGTGWYGLTTDNSWPY